MTRSAAIVLLAAALVTTACGGASPEPAGSPTSITVLAASSLTDAFAALKKTFEQAHPGARVTLAFGGSSELAREIRAGAPGDVFASADTDSMSNVAGASRVDGQPTLLAHNRLVIVVRPGNPRAIHSLADLAAPALTVALCAPAVPCGRYAREAFGKAGATVPAASQETDVRAVLRRVERGEAEAGVVYASDAVAAGSRVATVAVPDAANVTATYQVALLKGAADRTTAQAFIALLLSTRGRDTLVANGFLPP